MAVVAAMAAATVLTTGPGITVYATSNSSKPLTTAATAAVAAVAVDKTAAVPTATAVPVIVF